MNGRFTARPVRNTPRKLHDYIWAIPWVFNESLAYAPRDCFSMQNLTEPRSCPPPHPPFHLP